MKTISGSAGISILIPALVLAFSRELAARVDERAAAARKPRRKSREMINSLNNRGATVMDLVATLMLTALSTTTTTTDDCGGFK